MFTGGCYSNIQLRRTMDENARQITNCTIKKTGELKRIKTLITALLSFAFTPIGTQPLYDSKP